jgi:thiol-disulfide isomerase/thioredoxin
MRKLVFAFMAAFLLPNLLIAQNTKPTQNTKAKTITSASPVGHAIEIVLKPYQNTKIYLGTNYGRNRVLADSALLNEKSEGVFKSKTKLTPGIYFLVSPKYSILFDFLVDESQHFKIIADTLSLNTFQIIGSKENDIFKAYSKSINDLGVQLSSLENKYKTATNAKDSASFKELYLSKDKEVKAARANVIKTNPGSMTSFFLNVMQRPEAPAMPSVNGKLDSLYPYYYIKNHFWDNVIFNDNRLIRTPFFEEKLDEYFKNYVSRESDSIIEEVQYMLTVAKTGKEIYPFLLFKFTNKYIAPEFMGQEKVFIHLFQNFFAKGDTVLLNEASKKSITERAYSMMANQLGLAAPSLIINTPENKKISLYDQKAPYTLLAFWDPTCSHCKIEIPRLDSFYKASWKNLQVKIFSVNTNFKELAAWKIFIQENHLEDWTHAYQTEEDLNREIKAGLPTTIRQQYDVFKTPTFYLLDANKKIMAKNLSLEQFNDFLQNAHNKSAPKK